MRRLSAAPDARARPVSGRPASHRGRHCGLRRTMNVAIARRHDRAVGVGDRRLDVRDLPGELHDLAAHRRARSPTFGGAAGLVRDVEGRGPVARLERAVGGEVHRRVVHHAVHAAVHDAERVARELGRRPRGLGPALAVPLERQPELPEQRHAAVAERAVQVAHGGRGYRARDRSRVTLRRMADRGDRRRRPHAARPAQRAARGLASRSTSPRTCSRALVGAQRPRPRAGRRRDHGLRLAGRRAGAQHRPQRGARRRASPTPCRARRSTGSAGRRSRRCTSPRRA